MKKRKYESSPEAKQELASQKRHEECMARWRDGIVVVIEKVFLGRGVRCDHVRAKIIEDTRVHYVDMDELTPF